MKFCGKGTDLFTRCLLYSWLPPGLENLEKSEGIFQLGNFVKTGKVGKVAEFYSNTGKVMEICQPVIVKTLHMWYHTLSKKKNFKKYWKSLGNLSVRKSGNHVYFCTTFSIRVIFKLTFSYSVSIYIKYFV